MLPALLPFLGPVINKVLDLIPDPQKREAARLQAEKELRESETKILELISAADTSQTEINKVEAANQNLFVSGWRPFVGWVCGAGFAWATIIQPILVFLLAAFHHNMVTPQLQTEILIQTMSGLLGLGTMRMMEKKWGVANK